MGVLTELGELRIGPEERLLVEAVRACGGAAEGVARAAGSVTDWDRLVELAQAHRIGTALSRALGQACYVLEPPARKALDGLVMLEFGANMVSRALAEETVRALAAGGLRPMLLKGAAVDRLVYPADLPRTMADVDPLLDHSEIETAERCLSQRGFVRVEPSDEEDDRYHTVMVSQGRAVELHWRVTHIPPFRFDNAKLKARAQVLHLADGAECLAPGYPDLFVQAAFHWASINRFYSGLQSLLDLVLLMRQRPEELNTNALVSRAVETRTTGALYWTLLTLQSWGGVDVDEAALSALRPPGWLVREGAREVERSFVHSLSHLGPRVEFTQGVSWLNWHLACTTARNPIAALPAVAYRLLRAPRRGPESLRLRTPLQRAAYLLRPARWRKLWGVVTGR